MESLKWMPSGLEDEEDFEEESFVPMVRNLKITIVPEITTAAALNGVDADCKLSAELEAWLKGYRELWNTRKIGPLLQEQLRRCLLKDEQPLLLALKFFANSPGCNNLKNKSLALFILESVCSLHQSEPEIARGCEDNTRMIAFNFVKTCGVVSLYAAVMQAYGLQQIQDLLVPKIRELIAQGHYKDAAYWAIHLKITDIFDVCDIVFPLLLQEKLFLAEEYLNASQGQLSGTITFLDSLLHRKKSVFELSEPILSKYKYVDVKHNILSYRPMSKMVMRLAKKYKIDASLTPNLNFTKSCSYLHYLHRKFQEGGMSCDSFRELVRDAATTKDLQIDFVENIAAHSDLPESVYWAAYFQLPPDVCPTSVQELLTGSAAQPTLPDYATGTTSAGVVAPAKMRNGSTAQSQDFLLLVLPDEQIILVDTRSKFLDMLKNLSQQPLIAFDSEWKPSIYNDNAVSLLQLATRDTVYLLDCLAPELDKDLWRHLGTQIFNNLEILKIGFSLQQDLQLLHKSLPLQLKLQANSCYLDLRELWRRLKHTQNFVFPYGNGLEVNENLCTLAELCLGKKLDKSNQCSNWANRPLRQDQIVYAALDAFCLQQIYQVLSDVLQRIGIDIDKVVEEITTGKTGYLYGMRRIATVGRPLEAEKTISKGRSSVSATNLKLICDRMLVGLARELRKLGIDSVEATKRDIHLYLEMARQENRFFLTQSTRYARFVNELPRGLCLDMPADSCIEQVIKLIYGFDIAIDRRHLFSRCLVCNSNVFIAAHRDTMHSMRFDEIPTGNLQKDLALLILPRTRTVELLGINKHVIRTRTTFQGKKIQLKRIKNAALQSQESFFICDNCGACTWDGAHTIHTSILKAIGLDE